MVGVGNVYAKECPYYYWNGSSAEFLYMKPVNNNQVTVWFSECSHSVMGTFLEHLKNIIETVWEHFGDILKTHLEYF